MHGNEKACSPGTLRFPRREAKMRSTGSYNVELTQRKDLTRSAANGCAAPAALRACTRCQLRWELAAGHTAEPSARPAQLHGLGCIGQSRRLPTSNLQSCIVPRCVARWQPTCGLRWRCGAVLAQQQRPLLKQTCSKDDSRS